MDSTVIGVTGSQEGAEKGYNPKKKGQKSYPFSVVLHCGDARVSCINWFRSVLPYTSNGVEILKECYERIPQRVAPVVCPGGQRFLRRELLDFLESRQSEYLIKEKMRKPRRRCSCESDVLATGEKENRDRNCSVSAPVSWMEEGASLPVAIRKLVAVQTEGVSSHAAI